MLINILWEPAHSPSSSFRPTRPTRLALELSLVGLIGLKLGVGLGLWLLALALGLELELEIELELVISQSA